MPLAPGTRLGPFEIATPLGAGGMGEVYRAKDTRLDRTVAIKILPAQFSLDPVHKQRFEREAKTISSLSHPHICVLHDVGSQDGVDYSGDGVRRVAESSAFSASLSAAPSGATYGSSLAWKIAAFGLVALAAFLGYLHWRDVQSASHSQVLRAFVDAQEKSRFNFTGDSGGPVTVSPDGSKLIFSASNYLWVRSLEDTVPRRLDGTQDAVFPFWSPDSRFIGFSADGKLKTMDISGSPPVALCDAPDLRGASWGAGGTIFFETGPRTGIFRIAGRGGNAITSH
jgi:hypothetical protein